MTLSTPRPAIALAASDTFPLSDMDFICHDLHDRLQAIFQECESGLMNVYGKVYYLYWEVAECIKKHERNCFGTIQDFRLRHVVSAVDDTAREQCECIEQLKARATTYFDELRQLHIGF